MYDGLGLAPRVAPRLTPCLRVASALSLALGVLMLTQLQAAAASASYLGVVTGIWGAGLLGASMWLWRTASFGARTLTAALVGTCLAVEVVVLFWGVPGVVLVGAGGAPSTAISLMCLMASIVIVRDACRRRAHTSDMPAYALGYDAHGAPGRGR